MGLQDKIERYLTGLATGNYQAAEEILHPDYEEYYPQTGERFQGLDTALEVAAAYPGLPSGEVVGVSGGNRTSTTVTRALPMGAPVVSVYGGDDAFTAELLLDYPGAGRFHVVVIGELDGGLIRRTRLYWSAPDDPAAWRAPFVEIVPFG